jgi:hypothetical protein
MTTESTTTATRSAEQTEALDAYWAALDVMWAAQRDAKFAQYAAEEAAAAVDSMEEDARAVGLTIADLLG